MDCSNSHPLYANKPSEQPQNLLSVVSLNEAPGSNIDGQQQINWSQFRTSLEQHKLQVDQVLQAHVRFFWSTLITKFKLNFSKSNSLLFPFSLNRMKRCRLHCNNKYLYKRKLCWTSQNLWRGMCCWKRMKRLPIYTWNYRTLIRFCKLHCRTEMSGCTSLRGHMKWISCLFPWCLLCREQMHMLLLHPMN